MSQQSIINPERRDPSNIRNKAEIGLSRVDNISYSDICNSIRDIIKDEVHRGDLYANNELKENRRFELPLCEITSESTAFTIIVSFLDNNFEVKSVVKASISYYFKLGASSNQRLDISFDLLAGQVVLSSSGKVSFNLYCDDSGLNQQAFFSLVCGSDLNTFYNISYVSYYFSDYVFVSDSNHDPKGFTQLSPNIAVGSNVDNLYGEYKPVTYFCKDGNRKVSSVAKSLPIYRDNGYGELVNVESLDITESDNYSIPTINGVPFTGSKNITYSGDSTREITIYSKHSNELATIDSAGEHDWNVLHTVPIVKYSSSVGEDASDDSNNSFSEESLEIPSSYSLLSGRSASDVMLLSDGDGTTTTSTTPIHTTTSTNPPTTTTTSSTPTNTTTSTNPPSTTTTSTTPIYTTTSTNPPATTTTTTKKPNNSSSAGSSPQVDASKPIDPNSLVSNYADVEYCSKESSVGSGLCTLVDIPAIDPKPVTSLDDAVSRLVSYTENVSRYNDEHVVSIGYLRRYTQYLSSLVTVLIDHFEKTSIPEDGGGDNNTESSTPTDSTVAGKLWFYNLTYTNNIPNQGRYTQAISSFTYSPNKDEVVEYGFSFSGYSKRSKILIKAFNSSGTTEQICCKLKISYWDNGTWNDYNSSYTSEVEILVGGNNEDKDFNNKIFRIQLKSLSDIYLNGSVLGEMLMISSNNKTISSDFSSIPRYSVFRRTIGATSYNFPVVLYSVGEGEHFLESLSGFSYRSFQDNDDKLTRFYGNSGTSYDTTKGLLWHNVTESKPYHYECNLLLSQDKGKVFYIRGFSMVRKLKIKVNNSGICRFRIYTKNQKSSTNVFSKSWSEIYGGAETDFIVDLWGDNSSVKPSGFLNRDLVKSSIDDLNEEVDKEYSGAEEFLIAISPLNNQIVGQFRDVLNKGEIIIGSATNDSRDYLTLKLGQRAMTSDLANISKYDKTRYGNNNVIIYPRADRSSLEGYLICNYEGVPGPVLNQLSSEYRELVAYDNNNSSSTTRDVKLQLSYITDTIKYRSYDSESLTMENNYYITSNATFENNLFSLLKTSSLTSNYLIKISSGSLPSLKGIKSISLTKNDGWRNLQGLSYPIKKSLNKIPCNIIEAERLSLQEFHIGCSYRLKQKRALKDRLFDGEFPSLSHDTFKLSVVPDIDEPIYSVTRNINTNNLDNCYFINLTRLRIALNPDSSFSTIDLSDNSIRCAYKIRFKCAGGGGILVNSSWINGDSVISDLFKPKGYDLLLNTPDLEDIESQLNNCSEITFEIALAFFKRREDGRYAMIHTCERSNIINYSITLSTKKVG